MRLVWWVLGTLGLVLAGCARSRPSPAAALAIPSRFELVSVNGLTLPAVDTLLGERVFRGALEFYRRDTLRVVHTFRARPYDRYPCAALRSMPPVRGTAGLQAVTDTVTAGCEDLRIITTDTQVVGYEVRGARIRTPDFVARALGDTIVVEQEVRDEMVGGTTRTRSRSLRYVRVAMPGPSREPQN